MRRRRQHRRVCIRPRDPDDDAPARRAVPRARAARLGPDPV